MRASRLLQILLLLQNRGRMTAAALAREVEVTPRTILRDVDALTEAGLPMVVNTGYRGGIELGFGGVAHGSLALSADGLLIVGGNDGLFACDPVEGGVATQIPDASDVRALTTYLGAVIVGGMGAIGDSIEDHIGVLGSVLPATNNDSRRATNTIVLLITLTAFTALAGTQLLRRA